MVEDDILSPPKLATKIEPVADRFWRKVDRGPPDACWNWLAATRGKGDVQYGVFGLGRNARYQAHRVAFILTFGPIPDGLILRHTCDNSRCVNPHHLLTGSLVDNEQDKMARGRRHRVCGTRNGRSVLSDDDVRRIRQRAASGDRYTRLAAQYGCSATNIQNIVKGKRWQHVL